MNENKHTDKNLGGLVGSYDIYLDIDDPLNVDLANVAMDMDFESDSLKYSGLYNLNFSDFPSFDKNY